MLDHDVGALAAAIGEPQRFGLLFAQNRLDVGLCSLKGGVEDECICGSHFVCLLDKRHSGREGGHGSTNTAPLSQWRRASGFK